MTDAVILLHTVARTPLDDAEALGWLRSHGRIKVSAAELGWTRLRPRLAYVSSA